MRSCAANDCEKPTHHEEVPFCSNHWRSLPKPHCKMMWEQRPEANGGKSGLEFDDLLQLGCAIALVRDGWTGPSPEHVDDQGFDWSSGLHDAVRLYKQAVTACERFPVRS